DITFLHELIHVAGGEELSAYNYAILLYHAIHRDLPPFNLLDLLNIDLETLNNVLNRHGFRDIEDYYEVMGIIPIEVEDLTSVRIKIRRDVSEQMIVQNFLVNISSGIAYWYEFESLGECQSIECRIFEDLAKHLASSKEKKKD
ncbi:MAG: hypothetical protein QXL19_09960, partial [Ignisphaera sp.]